MLSNDIELNGVGFNVVPGTYKKGLRKRLAVSKPAARKITRTTFGPFHDGFGQVAAESGENTAGWTGVGVGPAFDGLGVEPFPHSEAFADLVMTAGQAPTTLTRAYGLVAGNKAYVGIGTRLFESVAITAGTWSSWTLMTTYAQPITGMTYFLDDVMLFFGTAQDIRRFSTGNGATTVWRTGEKAKYGVAYAGQLIYGNPAANNQEQLKLSGTKWNGLAVTHKRWLDSPIINMSLFNGKVVIATRKSLYLMGGQPYEGEADDADVTGDTSKAPEWRGEPEPLMTHGVFAEREDFVFLESYRGQLYTWLGGRVARFDPAGQGSWERMGPEGTTCYGACVAGDWLLVAILSRYGDCELWGFDGDGWWLLFQRTGASSPVLWPMALAGAGDRDALLWRDGSATYDLVRLWRRNATTKHTYAASGAWESGVIDGGDPSEDKAWREIGATFAAPSPRGNTASVDTVSFPLEYSTDGGATWATVEDTSASSGATRIFTRGQAFAVPPQSRYLRIRQRWSSVSDWAPVLTSLWVECENAEDYALAELAQAAYEADLAAEGVLRRRWELTVDAGDRNVRRDGQVDTKTGRQAIAALWDAWELGTELDFKDVDNDTDLVTYLVTIAGIEEKAGKPSDAARWGESTVTLVLEEGEGLGAAAGGVHVHELDDLSDVALGALADGQVLTWDSGTGRWVNEAAVAPPPGASAPTGTIAAYAFAAAPSGWLLCDGTTVPRSSALGVLLLAAGLPYGVGDGATTVNLPNLKGRVPVGLDAAQTEFDALGETGGAKTVTLTAAQSGLPAHEHTYDRHAHTNVDRDSAGNANTANQIGNTGTVTTGGAAQAASQAHQNLSPYVVLTFIIKD